jgi:hypothetical protein
MVLRVPFASFLSLLTLLSESAEDSHSRSCHISLRAVRDRQWPVRQVARFRSRLACWKIGHGERAQTSSSSSDHCVKIRISSSHANADDSVQLAQSARARFHDEGFLSVTGAFSSPTGYDPFSDIAHDYDSPVAAHLDPLSISVHGVKNVGGVDIGYDPIDRDLAIVVLVILSFPSLEVGPPRDNCLCRFCTTAARIVGMGSGG